MPKRRKKRVAPSPHEGDDSAALHGVITAIMKAQGRGGLTAMATKLGTGSPSTLRKRLSNPKTAFCEITMRAVLMIAGSKADDIPRDATYEVIDVQEHDGYEILIYNVNGTAVPYWRAI